MSNVERRHFLRTGAIGAAGVAALGLTSTPAFAQTSSTFGYLITNDGSTQDYSTIFANAIAAVKPTGGYILVARGTYRFLTPIVLPSGVSLIGEAPRTESGKGTVLAKRAGFVGDALVKIVPTQDPQTLVWDLPRGITIDGIAIQDPGGTSNKQAGGGLLIQKASHVVLNNVLVGGHAGWGVIIESGYLCSMSGLVCISNGALDANTGGLKMDGSASVVEPEGPTGVGDCRIYDSLISKNMGSQIVLTGSGGNNRVFGLTAVSCQIETGGLAGLSNPLLKADCADRVAFISCNFAAAQQNIRCVSLGGSSPKVAEDITFSSCHFGFSSSANPAIQLLSNTTAASFIDMRHGGTGTKLIDASALTLGSPAQYKVLASAMPPITSVDVTDPNGVIRVPSLQAPV